MSLFLLRRSRNCAINRLCVARFSTTVITQSDDPFDSRFVAKIFKKNQRKLENTEALYHFPIDVPDHKLGKSKTPLKRRPILSANNPVLEQSERRFHENVSNIMQSGYIGVKVPVTKVRLIRDFSQLNIYWEATGNGKQDKKIQNSLNSKTKVMRHLLLSGQESGWYIPNISFLKDLSHVKEKEFEERFKDLDTGRPVNTSKLNNEGDFTRKQHGNEDVSGEIRKMYSQNVYGLPHNKLMKKVLSSKLKLRPDDKVKNEHENEMPSNVNDDLMLKDDGTVAESNVDIVSEVNTNNTTHVDRRKDQFKQYSRLFGVYSKKKDLNDPES